MDCRACGHTNREGRRFCGACGGSLALVCPACGTTDEDGERFCGGCGAELGAPPHGAATKSATSSGAPAGVWAPADYTPGHLADKILRSRSALEGERKQVTVMFADVRSSMELAEQLDPEVWHDVLDRFFAILSEGVHRFEGTINQYTGDGIMALFGAPISHEDHGQRACYAALHLLEELRAFTREVKRAHGVDFAVRIGLNSGEVVVGKIGDDLRMDYTAQGHTVGLAQRMESLASADSAYLSQPTAALVREYFDLEDLGEFAIKGATDPIHVFELVGPGTARTRFDVSRDRGLATFVGRSDEIALLEAALEQALAGPGRTIGVVAQAGTGKSRLCYEFVESARRRGVTVYEARGLSHGAQIPLLPIQELMRDFFVIEERDSDRVAREKIAGRTLLLDETLGEELPIFFDLLDVPDPARPLPEADPEVLKRRMYAAVRSIVKADGELDPGIVLLEDLHWLDPASAAMLAQIVEANALSKSLILVNFRPEYRAAWMQQAHYQQLSLLPLSEDALRELLRDLLGEDPSVRELPRTLYDRTAGNPFFIEEVVQSLVEGGQLVGSRGAYRLVAQLDALRVPESVQSLLASRIDRLGEREKHVLQSASVIGKNFREPILRRVVELPEAELQTALQALQGGEFIYEAALYPDHEYAFKHPLTQEVAERSQLGDRRAQRHAAVARALEDLAPEHLDGRAALLAHHWEHANEPVRAAHWHARAAGRMGSTDYREALAHWRRVDELVRGDERTEAVDLQTRAFIERTLSAFRVEVSEREAEEVFARGRAFLESRGDDANLARLTSAFSTVRQNRGRMVEYLALAEESMAIARRVGDPALRAFCGLEVCYARWQNGAATGAVEAGDDIVELASGDLELGSDVGHSPLILCMAFTAGPRVDLGLIDEAEERIETARRLAQNQPPETQAWLSLMQTVVHQGRGDAEAALRSAQQCRALAERSGSAFDLVASHCWLAMTLCDCGEWEGCANEMQLGRAAYERSGFGRDVFIWTGWSEALAHFRLGDVARARTLIDEVIAVATEQQTRINLCRALIVRAEIHKETGADADAEADLEHAERLIEETGARRHRGWILEARGRLAEALAFYREIGATGHARRVERLIAP